LSGRERRRRGLYDIPAAAAEEEKEEEEDRTSPTAGNGKKKDRKCRTHSYDTFRTLHRMWLGYIREVLGSDMFSAGGSGSGAATAAAAAKLSAAEFHGAELEVVRSGCVGRVGIKGFVMRDTRFTFELIGPRDRVKVVPKEGTIFRVRVPLDDAGDATAVGTSKEGVHAAASKPDTTTGPGTAATASTHMTAPDATFAATTTNRDFVFEIHGEQFKLRSADRANRKFKQHFLKYL
jgi:ribonuclease P protein subunit POP4